MGNGWLVFVDDGEGGRGYFVFNAEFLADGFDERGLTGAHRAVEGKNGAVCGHVGDELTRGLVDVCDRGYGESH